MGKCLAGAALCRCWMDYHHGYILQNKQHTSKLQAETSQYLAREKKLVATRGKKCLVSTPQKMELEHKSLRLRSFVDIIVLNICFSRLHFLLFVILVVVVDDDTYYWVYLSSDHPFQVYYKVRQRFYYKVRQVLQSATEHTSCLGRYKSSMAV